MGLGHVGSHRAVAPPKGRTLVTGHPFALVDEFNHLGTETRLELLLDQGVGYGIVVPVDVHVIIDVLCARAHKTSYVASKVMWRQRQSHRDSEAPWLARRHISTQVITTGGRPSAL